MMLHFLASGVANTGDIIPFFLIGPVLFVIVVLMVRCCFWTAQMASRLWHYYHPRQDPLLPELPLK